MQGGNLEKRSKSVNAGQCRLIDKKKERKQINPSNISQDVLSGHKTDSVSLLL